MMNENIKKIKNEIKIYKMNNNIIMNVENDIYSDSCIRELENILNTPDLSFLGFTFKCELKNIEQKNIPKEINSIAVHLEKESIDGCVFFIKDDEIFFSVRGNNSLERCRMLCAFLKDASSGGNDRCANGKGLILK